MLGTPGAPNTLDGGVADPLETRYSPTRVIPNFVAPGQLASKYGAPKNVCKVK